MKKTVAIIGGGTAGMFLAAFLDSSIFEVTIYEKKPSMGRKFLVAGDGGFNLTHGEEMDAFKNRYTPHSFLDRALNHFGNDELRTFLSELNIPTFVGTSGRVFPEKGIKPIEVLKKIENHLIQKKVKFEFGKTFVGWGKENELIFKEGQELKSDYVVFALGGASWKVTGSDGTWLELFQNKQIPTLPFKSANCAFEIDWSEDYIKKHGGTPLKNISITAQNKSQKGEAVITSFGLEGNAIYALSPIIQEELAKKGKAIVTLDFKPSLSLESLISKLNDCQSNTSTCLKKEIKLVPAIIELLKIKLSKAQFLDVQSLAKCIKNYPFELVGAGSIDEAISTDGGIDLNAVNDHFEVKNLKNHFCIGEMLNWNAPTGGYLIQACSSMGVYLANHLNGRTVK